MLVDILNSREHGRVVNKLFIAGVFNLNFSSCVRVFDEQDYV
jgi:hypothetical protein